MTVQVDEMYRKALEFKKSIVAIAPMMDWTDRHCRFFHRQLTQRALLYTEMVVADAVINGQRERLLGFSPQEQPVALQIGGSDPGKMAAAAKIGEAFGYCEINMNVGCPSDRVKSGTFGACLMETPELVADCVAAMKDSVNIPVTVKCRIGVDEQDPEIALNTMADQVFTAGADALWVHARKAWLKGLSPKENREIPPLDYDLVYHLKARLQDRFIGVNGGIATLVAAKDHLQHVDGVMLGRAVYHEPGLLSGVDNVLSASDSARPDIRDVVSTMAEYAVRHIARGGRLNQVTRHMLGLFHGRPGARTWRQMMSVDVSRPDADTNLMLRALDAVEMAQAA
jgi:tRNA-dihydrouridine synthase A